VQAPVVSTGPDANIAGPRTTSDAHYFWTGSAISAALAMFWLDAHARYLARSIVVDWASLAAAIRRLGAGRQLVGRIGHRRVKVRGVTPLGDDTASTPSHRRTPRPRMIGTCTTWSMSMRSAARKSRTTVGHRRCARRARRLPSGTDTLADARFARSQRARTAVGLLEAHVATCKPGSSVNVCSRLGV
jgi:hypothetical protein